MKKRLQNLFQNGWLAIAFAVYLLSGVYFVSPEQQAVVLRFGRVLQKRVPSGIHYHLPYPFERVVKLKALETKRLSIGVAMPEQILGRPKGAEAQFLTGDQNIIVVGMVVQYSINDPALYLFNSAKVSEIVSTSVESAFTQTITSEQVDSILTVGRVAVQSATWRRAQQLLDHYRSGVSLSAIGIESVAAPEEVADAFREVASARADRDRIINEARGYASDATAMAKGGGEKLVSEAESYRRQRIDEARGQADRFMKLMEEYERARDVTEKRLYLEAMEEILPRIRKTIVDTGAHGNAMDFGFIRPGP